MDPWTVLAIAVGLAMDAFAVSVVAGLTIGRVTFRHVFRIAFHFGLFQFLMPVLGWMAGRSVAAYISGFDHWVAFGLLTMIGGKMLWEARRPHHAELRKDPTRGWMLVALSVATSVDALAVGLSLAFLKIAVWGPSLVIGAVAATLSALGILFGGRMGLKAGRVAEVAGGAVLIGIGLRILFVHLAGSP